MGTVSVSLPSDGETADVSDYNTPITSIVNEINGSLDNSNLASDAAIAGTKLASGGVDTTQLADDAVTTAKIADSVWSNNVEHLSYAGSGTIDVNTGSFTDLSANTATATVPSWATKAIVTTTINRTSVVSAATEYQMKVVIGSDSGDTVTQIHPSTANESYVETWVDQITLTGTGSKTLKVQALRVSGSGALRVLSSTRFKFRVEYKA